MRREKKAKCRAIVERHRLLINRALIGYLSKLKGPPIIRKAMAYAIFSGGKRLRPILTIESCRALRGDAKKALPLACAVEFVHNFSLIHDDLPAMDNDDFRRGRPTCHRKFGEGLAILAGDGLLNLAFGVISRLKQKGALKITSILSGAIGTENMIGGQALDIGYNNCIKKKRRLKNRIDSMKTASLMAISCKIGAIAADAKTQDTKRIYGFGRNLGLAFQIADDLEDSRHNRSTLNRMKKEVTLYISKGKRYIASFKERADTLRYIADTVLKRVGEYNRR